MSVMDVPLQFADYDRIVFFTGAGMSAESGVPTYRGKGGLWHEYNFEEYACQDAFDSAPDRVWDFHDQRREMTAKCAPHAGHVAIARVLEKKPNALIVTQNIDGMHQRAGADRVIELHGSMWRVRCDRCGVIEASTETPKEPRRHHCGTPLRPDIVWFGDALRADAISDASTAIAACDLLVAVGTSAVVYPAAQLPMLAAEQGATLVEINPEPTAMSELYPHRIRAAASAALTAMAANL